MKEYRWRVEETGESHYFDNLVECICETQITSRKRPELAIKLEQFTPSRKTLAIYKAGHGRPVQHGGKCPKCYGTGRNLSFPFCACLECNGTGKK